MKQNYEAGLNRFSKIFVSRISNDHFHLPPPAPPPLKGSVAAHHVHHLVALFVNLTYLAAADLHSEVKKLKIHAAMCELQGDL